MKTVYAWPNGIQPPVLYANRQFAVTKSGLYSLVSEVRSTPFSTDPTNGDVLCAPYFSVEFLRLNLRKNHIPSAVMSIVRCADWVIPSEFLDAYEAAVNLLNIKGRTYFDRDDCMTYMVDECTWADVYNKTFSKLLPEHVNSDLSDVTAEEWRIVLDLMPPIRI